MLQYHQPTGRSGPVKGNATEQGTLRMRTLRNTLILAFALFPFMAVHAAERGCERACLHDLVDSYLKAVLAHNPAQAPIIVGFRQTENTEVKRVGTGLWKTLTAVHEGGNYYLDPVNGQALWFGTVYEGNNHAVTMVRLKVVDRRITEAEWFITRPGLGSMQGPAQPDGTNQLMAGPDYLEANRPPVRNIPRKERLSRLSLMGVANSYFDGLTENDGSIVLAHPDCFRVENGVKTTGRPLASISHSFCG